MKAITTMDGYRSWAESYDLPGNQLIDLEQPIVREILAELEPGIALDAACGTGRHTEYLASLGHGVTGVDSSAEMLAKARAKIPAGEFLQADLHSLPIQDDFADVVGCALSLTHVPELAPVLAELVRVLRPGGHLLISDARGLIGTGILVKVGPDGSPGDMPNHVRLTSDYLRRPCRLVCRIAAVRSLAAHSPWLTQREHRAVIPTGFPPTSPTRRPTSGRCILGAPRPPTPPSVTARPSSSATSSSPPSGPGPRSCRYGAVRRGRMAATP